MTFKMKNQINFKGQKDVSGQYVKTRRRAASRRCKHHLEALSTVRSKTVKTNQSVKLSNSPKHVRGVWKTEEGSWVKKLLERASNIDVLVTRVALFG